MHPAITHLRIDRWGKYRLGFDFCPNFQIHIWVRTTSPTFSWSRLRPAMPLWDLLPVMPTVEVTPEIFSTCFAGCHQRCQRYHGNLVGYWIQLQWFFNAVMPCTMKLAPFGVWHGRALPTNCFFFSSAVKQYSGLTQHGPGAIFKTKISVTPAQELSCLQSWATWALM